MTVEAEVMRTGCFGAASIFRPDSVVCKKCEDFADCGPEAHRRLKIMQSKIDVSDLLAKHTAAAPAMPATSEPKTAPVVETAPATVADQKVTVNPPKRTTKVERVKAELTERDRAAIELVPKKVGEELRKIYQRYVEGVREDEHILKMVGEGENPFPFEGRRFLHVACQMLLSGGFTRKGLREAYEKHPVMQWQRATAAAHVSIVVSLFPALGIAQEVEGVFVKPL